MPGKGRVKNWKKEGYEDPSNLENLNKENEKFERISNFIVKLTKVYQRVCKY